MGARSGRRARAAARRPGEKASRASPTRRRALQLTTRENAHDQAPPRHRGRRAAGIYAADILLKAERKFDVSIDLFDQLPAPYGLVRYGVAPDHPRIKGIITALREVLDRGDIRLFGNVRFGEDITLDDLKQHYNAVIFATGAVRDPDLDIPGIDLPRRPTAPPTSSAGSTATPTFRAHWPLDAASVAVIGNGNVALDVARMLAKHAEDLLPTEIPDNVYAGLAASPVTDVHVFGRRGPMQVKFTPLELRELGELRDVDMVALRRGLRLRRGLAARDREQQAGLGHRPRPAARGAASREEAGRPPAACTCTSTRRPLEIVGDDDGRRGAPLRAHRAGRRGRRRRHRRDPRAADAGRVPRGRLLRLAAARHPVRREARRDPEPRGPGARRRTTRSCTASTRPAGSSAGRSD